MVGSIIGRNLKKREKYTGTKFGNFKQMLWLGYAKNNGKIRTCFFLFLEFWDLRVKNVELHFA